jgi:hypothetical protein
VCPCIEVVTKSDLRTGEEGLRSVSAVTREGVETLRGSLLEILSSSQQRSRKMSEQVVPAAEELVFTGDTLWLKEGIILGGVLEQGRLRAGDVVLIQTSKDAHFKERVRVKNIRDALGRSVEEFGSCGQLCTVFIELERQRGNQWILGEAAAGLSDQTTSGSSSSFVPSKKLRKRLQPPLLLVSREVEFRSRVKVVVPWSAEGGWREEGVFLMYWRGNRQECRLVEVQHVFGVHICEFSLSRRDEFFAKNSQVLLEALAPPGLILLGRVID